MTNETGGEVMPITTANVSQPIPREECIDLLRTKNVGRISVVLNARPKIFPVNYVADVDGTITFRTAPGTKLSGTPLCWVAFEIDHIDEYARAGWSVVVEGIGQEITNAIDRRSVERRLLAIEPWAAGTKANWLEILPRSITGRRLGCASPAHQPGG